MDVHVHGHCRRREAVRRHPNGGYVSLELILGLALLVLPITLIVLTVPTWLARQNAARLAAQQAARVAVVSGSPDQGRKTARTVATDAGLDPAKNLTVAYEPGSSFARGGLGRPRRGGGPRPGRRPPQRDPPRSGGCGTAGAGQHRGPNRSGVSCSL